MSPFLGPPRPSSSAGGRTRRSKAKSVVVKSQTKKSATQIPAEKVEVVYKEKVHGNKGKLPPARKKSLIKAMKGAIASNKTPAKLIAGLKRKLAEYQRKA